MRLYFVHNPDMQGAMYGFSTHIRKMKEALAAIGETVTTDPAEPFDLAVHVCAAKDFQAIPGKRNLLFTMCESDPPFSGYTHPNMKAADLMVTPSTFCSRVLKPFFPGPVFTCPEGVDPKQYPYHAARERPKPWDPWRFLWVGAWDRRKGNELVQQAWSVWANMRRMPVQAELYLKTTGVAGPELKSFYAYQHDNGFVQFVDEEKLPPAARTMPRIVMDTRNLPGAELTKLYQSAHVFLQPSLGEGFGLAIAEALAQGIPTIWTHWSAPEDYADESIGFPITRYKMSLMTNSRLGMSGYGAEADVRQVVERMEEIIRDYPAALAKGRKASERMHEYFPWEQAALKFRRICRNFLEGKAAAPVAAATVQG